MLYLGRMVKTKIGEEGKIGRKTLFEDGRLKFLISTFLPFTSFVL